MPENKHLALFIDAPMQSWGYQSKFERRTSLSYPTKSGIIGLVSAAMGIPKTNTGGLAKLADLKMTVYSFKKGECQPVHLIDYHTVGGGYDEKEQKANIVKTADGKTRGTVQTYREFLLDAKFAVILSGDGGMLGKIHDALSNPKWGVWFGRKSCIPASPIAVGIFNSDEEALGAVTQKQPELEKFRKIHDAGNFSDGTDSIMDFPLDFSEPRRFGIRRVAVDEF